MKTIWEISEEAEQEIRQILIAANREDLSTLLAVRSDPTEEEMGYCVLAQESSDEDLEFDEQPFVSVGKSGAFVSAWVWVPSAC